MVTVKMVVMTALIRCVYGGENVKDWDMDEAHGKIQEVDSKGGLRNIERNSL